MWTGVSVRYPAVQRSWELSVSQSLAWLTSSNELFATHRCTARLACASLPNTSRSNAFAVTISEFVHHIVLMRQFTERIIRRTGASCRSAYIRRFPRSDRNLHHFRHSYPPLVASGTHGTCGSLRRLCAALDRSGQQRSGDRATRRYGHNRNGNNTQPVHASFLRVNVRRPIICWAGTLAPRAVRREVGVDDFRHDLVCARDGARHGEEPHTLILQYRVTSSGS